MILGEPYKFRATSTTRKSSTFKGILLSIASLLSFLILEPLSGQVNPKLTSDSTHRPTKNKSYSGVFYGQVWDGETRDPMAFASLRWGSTGKGGITNFEGEFNLGKGPDRKSVV